MAPKGVHPQILRSMDFAILAIELIEQVSVYAALTFSTNASVVLRLATADTKNSLRGEKLTLFNQYRRVRRIVINNFNKINICVQICFFNPLIW